jgi:hypothetical protein
MSANRESTVSQRKGILVAIFQTRMNTIPHTPDAGEQDRSGTPEE